MCRSFLRSKKDTSTYGKILTVHSTLLRQYAENVADTCLRVHRVFHKNNARHIPAGHSCHPLYQSCTRVYSLSGTDHPKNVRSDFDRDVWRKRRIAFSFI